MAKATGKTATKTPQNNKKAETDESVIYLKTGKPADSQKKAKPAKKPAPKAKKSKKEPLKKESTNDEIKDAINSDGTEVEPFNPTPIELNYLNAGQDPDQLKELMTAMKHYHSELDTVKVRHNADLAECRNVWAENKKPIQENIQRVYDMAAEKGVSAAHFDFLMQMNKPMSKTEYENLQQQRQLTLDVFGI